MLKWYEESGNNNDVVISSRIRLARNLSKYPFSAKLSPYAAKDMVLELKEKLSDFMKKDEREYEYISLEQLTDVEKVGLVERNVLSEALISKEGTTAAIISKDEAVSIMLNEEDHIRIQALVGGMNFEKAFSIADKIDDNINMQFQYAFDERMGFLTSFLTNISKIKVRKQQKIFHFAYLYTFYIIFTGLSIEFTEVFCKIRITHITFRSQIFYL